MHACVLPAVPSASTCSSATLATGSSCTPDCLDGYERRGSNLLWCFDGDLAGSFSCYSAGGERALMR